MKVDILNIVVVQTPQYFRHHIIKFKRVQMFLIFSSIIFLDFVDKKTKLKDHFFSFKTMWKQGAISSKKRCLSSLETAISAHIYKIQPINPH